MATSNDLPANIQQLDFNPDDLAPQAFAFRYLGKDYILHEPTEQDKINVRSHQLKGATLTDGKLIAQVDKMAETQSLLLSMCIRDGEKNQLVPVNAIRRWPPKLVRKLHDRLTEIGGLDESKQEDKEKAFQDAVSALSTTSTNDTERQQWREWMLKTVNDTLDIAPHKGTAEEHAKN